MTFISFHFLVFFPVVFLVYYALPIRWRVSWLLAASFYFYAAFIPVYTLILVFLMVIDFWLGKRIERSTGRDRTKYLAISIVANLSVLFIFKYFNFFGANLQALADFLHWNYSVSTLKLLLPLGLSFHVFQSLSYVIEVYRGRVPTERRLSIYMLYVMFWPQLVAGPIERPYHVLPQLHHLPGFDRGRIVRGLQLMLWGFFKKMVIADRLGVLVSHVYDNPDPQNGVVVALATVAFAWQIFCDFSGYTDIARGAAETMGVTLMENFRRPYFAKSIADFWRRWHISLSSWFRDYIYIPLGGSRAGKARQCVAIMAVFLASGLWHGADWKFVLWGALFALYIIIGLLTKKIRERLVAWSRIESAPRLYKVLQVGYTFLLVCFAWIFFRASSLSAAVELIKRLGVGWSHIFEAGWLQANVFSTAAIKLSGLHVLVVCGSIAVMEGVHLLQRRHDLHDVIARQRTGVRWLVYYALVVSILFFSYSGEGIFIYFQF